MILTSDFSTINHDVTYDNFELTTAFHASVSAGTITEVQTDKDEV